jgi:hypothetical protein
MNTSIKIAISLLFLATLCSAQNNEGGTPIIVEESRLVVADHNERNVGVVVTEAEHTTLLMCNASRKDCFMPEAGDIGHMYRNPDGPYEGHNVAVSWKSNGYKGYYAYLIVSSQ